MNEAQANELVAQLLSTAQQIAQLPDEAMRRHHIDLTEEIIRSTAPDSVDVDVMCRAFRRRVEQFHGLKPKPNLSVIPGGMNE